MKHEATINKIFEVMYKPGMTDEDKAFVKSELLKRMGYTIEQIDEDIEIGVKNGYPPEFQVEIMRRIWELKQKE